MTYKKIIKKQKKAAALKYDKAYKSPIVTALGYGHVADKIIETASENKVPVVENSLLVEKLTKLDIGQAIPEELYEAVAEVIAFIYKINDSIKN